MQNTFEKYKDFTATDFVLDDDFINWIVKPDEENTQFWNRFISINPQQVKNIEDARMLINSFETSIEKVDEEIKNRVWKSIQSKSATSKVIQMKGRISWMVAASVIVIMLAAGGYFYLNNNNNGIATTKRNKQLTNDILPGGNKAVLTLANGNTINLDSAANGTLAQQGNAKIIKMSNGQIVYDAEGISSNTEIGFNTMTTPRGGQYKLTLPDGTNVWLNAGSSITYPTAFIEKDRKVAITGEAYFEVAHDAKKPFRVSVNGMEVRVLGTHFNINAYADETSIKTTLLEGSVRIIKDNNVKLISPGQQVQLDISGEFTLVKNADINETMAWKNGYFSFKNADLKMIMRQISRWYDVDVVFEGAVPSVEFSGEIGRQLTLTQFLSVLVETRIHYRIDGNKLIIVS